MIRWEGAGANAKYADDDEKYDFEKVPVAVVRNLKEYEFAGAERVHSLKDDHYV